MTIKQKKQEIRKLKKIRKELRKGTDEYKEIRKKIKKLKTELAELSIVSTWKQKLIDEINQLTPKYLLGLIDLKSYSEKQLEVHLKKLQEKKMGINENFIYYDEEPCNQAIKDIKKYRRKIK